MSEPNTTPAPFDAYHRWLGIPPDEQPAHHYRLLGLSPFESDPEVIRDAALQRMAHVRTYQLGKHLALSQQVLNELAAAKSCLLDPQKKAAYDARLRRELPAEQGPEVGVRAVPPQSVPPVDGARTVPPPMIAQPDPFGARRRPVGLLLGAVVVIVTFTLILTFLLVPRRRNDVGSLASTGTPATVAQEESRNVVRVEPQASDLPPRRQEPAAAPEPASAPPAPAPAPSVPVTPPVERRTSPVERKAPPPAAASIEPAEELLDTAFARAKNAADYRDVARDALALADQSVAAGKQDLAKRATRLALLAGRKAEETARVAQIEEKPKPIAEIRSEQMQPPSVPPLANLSGTWKSTTGSIYQVTDRGRDIDVRLVSGPQIAQGKGLLIRTGDHLKASLWRVVFKNDSMKRPWDLRFEATVVDARTLQVEYEYLSYDSFGNVKRTYPMPGSWKKLR